MYYEEFTSEQERILQSVVGISGSLSLIACFLVFLAYVLLKETQVFHLRLILNLTITDCCSALILVAGAISRGWSVGSGDGSDPYYAVCLIIGALVEFFLLASILWTACLAHTLFIILYLHDYNPERFEKYYHILCWSVPAIFDILLIISGSFGDAGLWCWIRGDKGYNVFRYLCLYIPLLGVIIYNCALYSVTYVKLRRERNRYTPRYTEDSEFVAPTSSNSDPYRIQASFGYFIMILIVCWFFPILNQFLHILFPDRIFITVYVLNGIFLPLQGFLNSLVYGLNDGVRSKLMRFRYLEAIANLYTNTKEFLMICLCPECCCNYCCRFCKKPPEENISVYNNQSTMEDRKKWYQSFITEYDDIPERRPSGDKIANAVLSIGSLTNSEFRSLVTGYATQSDHESFSDYEEL